jgi:BirA family biotin operon repressor/biotin-[acetyl-CoA-carboxylase] ligase
MIKKIHRFKEVSSTQDTAKRFIDRNEEIAVLSFHQRRGRGRHGRTWHSPGGGMYLSLLLLPKTRITSIPLLASLAVVKVLEEYGLTKIGILWPNDVLVKDKKICGIICEQYKKSLICGIGLNVNTERFARTLSYATSIRIETGQEYEIDQIANHVIETFNPLYEELQEEGIRIKEVLNYIKGIGESVEVVTPKEVIEGTVYDIDDDWALLLRDHAGIIRKFYYGDVRQLLW